MDQKFVDGGGKVAAVLIFFCALMILPLGFGMLFSFPDSIWMLGVILLGCGAVFIYSSIAIFKRALRMQRQTKEKMSALAAQMQSSEGVRLNANNLSVPGGSPTGISILVHWTYTADEWKRFVTLETKTRRTNTTIEAGLLIIVGAVAVHWTKEAGWGLSIGLSAGVALLYWLGKYFLSMHSIGKASRRGNEVVVTPAAVVINGSYNAFNSDLYSFKEALLNEHTSPATLEIVYQWQTRNGLTQDEIRIPVPAGKLEEARIVLSSLK